MTVSREEFFRLLPAALGAFDVEGDLVRWSEGERRATIRLVPLPNRRGAQGSSLALLRIPRHQVDIDIEGCPEAEGEAFMARFHRAFLRGGG